MTPSPHASVRIDLSRLRRSAGEIAARVRVPVWAVVKADAYGLGAAAVAEALAPAVHGFAVFDLREAVAAKLWERTGKPAIALGPPSSLDPDEHLAHHVRPAVWTARQAAALRRADPLLCVDTGMQRFACPPEQIDAVLAAGGITEAFTHATNPEHVRRLVLLARGKVATLHAAASALLDDPAAWLDAVRPGLAIYRGAVEVATALSEVRDTRGPVGYTRFDAPRVGVILCGYAQGVRPGPCLVDGRPSRIMEVGMQSAYVQVTSADHAGAPVTLLSESLPPEQVGHAWSCTPHEALLRLSQAGIRRYVNAPPAEG